MRQPSRRRASPGDLVRIDGHRVGDGRRTGVIVDVLGEAEREHYQVRWEDDAETIFYPGASDATIEHQPRRARKQTAPPESRLDEPDWEGPVLTHDP